MSRIAVLISGEMRGLKECLPNMKFIDDSVDVYVSTWNKTLVQDKILGISEYLNITEESIKALLPKAVVLVENSRCFRSIKYSDSMIHRWVAGWKLIKDSGKKYDKIIVTRSDMFFDPTNTKEEFKLSDENVFEIIWNDSDETKQDALFAASPGVIDSLFRGLTPEHWQHSSESDIHKWFAKLVKDRVHIPNQSIFKEARFIFFRSSTTVGHATMGDAARRHDDWRDAKMIQRIKDIGYPELISCWSGPIVKGTVLTHKSGRLVRKKNNRSLVVFSGIVRNYEAALLSLPVFGNCDVALSTWDTEDARRFYEIARCDLSHLSNFDAYNLSVKPTSEFNQNIEYQLHHWENAFNIIQHTDYDRYFIVRPDLFIWSKTNFDALDLNKFVSITEDGVSSADYFFAFDKSHLSTFGHLPKKMRKLSREHKSANIHTLLPLAFREGEFGPSNLHDIILDTVIQRDTFDFRMESDCYDRDFYTALLANSASWWRKNHPSKYHISARGL